MVAERQRCTMGAVLACLGSWAKLPTSPTVLELEDLEDLYDLLVGCPGPEVPVQVLEGVLTRRPVTLLGVEVLVRNVRPRTEERPPGWLVR